MQDVDIKTDPQTGESRGFGFLLYKEESSIEEVVNNGPHNLGMHFKDYSGKKIFDNDNST